MQTFLRDMRSERQDGDGLQIQWSPQTLHRLLDERLPGAEVLAVSNREPYIHNVHNGSVALQIPASGLVAALEPVMRACGGTWVAGLVGSAVLGQVFDRLGWTACVIGIGLSLAVAAVLTLRLRMVPRHA